MKKAMYYTLVVIVFFVLGYVLNHLYHDKPEGSSRKTYTKAELDSLERNFGVISLKDTANPVFLIKNVGKRPLLIKFIQTDCGCTIVDWNDKPIPPGDTSRIHVRITPLEKGYFSKRITVFCNDRRSPFYLRVKGKVTGI